MELTMMKKPVTAMVASTSIAEAKSIILNSRVEGADAFYVQLELLPRADRTEQKLRELFSFCNGKPILITAYRTGDPELTDDERAELLLLGLRSGAHIADIPGDYWHPEQNQLTFDKAAIRKQKALIDQVHSIGKGVLMSSHLSRFFRAEEIYAYAKEQEAREADFLKIVSKSETEEQLMENLIIAAELKNQVKKPYLFLGNGSHSKLLRLIGPSLGVCMYLCVQHFNPLDFCDQPMMRSAMQIRNILE